MKDQFFTETKENLKGSYMDLPDDILCDIFSRLFAGDRVVFRSVCRSLNSVSPLPDTLGGRQTKLDLACGPYLMFMDKIFHPIYSKSHHLEFPHMPGTIVRCARDDWLLMAQGSKGMFFFNPFTKEKVTLPDITGLMHIGSVYFSSPPTSTDWKIVAGITSHTKEARLYVL